MSSRSRGTNRIEGSGFFYVRDESFDARNAFVPAGGPKPPFERKNLGFSVGGPIVRDRAFFFAPWSASIATRAKLPTILSPGWRA